MIKIGERQITEVYAYSKQVYSKSISLKNAIERIHSNTGMGLNSANGYIRVFLRMMEGRQYERTLNPEATEFYLTNIRQDFGDRQLEKALEALHKHLVYYEKTSKNHSKQLKIQVIYQRYKDRIRQELTEYEYRDNFESLVKSSMADDNIKRQKRLASARVIPDTQNVVSKIFVRNPDVVAEVLIRSGGICQGCKNTAPFLRASDNTPYLEVHHRVPLSKGGEDTVENALALCPNCHRERHFGIAFRDV